MSDLLLSLEVTVPCAIFICTLAICITIYLLAKLNRKKDLQTIITEIVKDELQWQHKNEFEKLQQNYLLKKQGNAKVQHDDKNSDKNKDSTEEKIEQEKEILQTKQRLILKIYELVDDKSKLDEKNITEIEKLVDSYISNIENNILKK